MNYQGYTTIYLYWVSGSDMNNYLSDMPLLCSILRKEPNNIKRNINSIIFKTEAAISTIIICDLLNMKHIYKYFPHNSFLIMMKFNLWCRSYFFFFYNTFII